MTDRYVATTGNDTTGNGTIGNPYKTIGKADSVAVAGDIIHVASGTYTGNVTTSKAGTALARIKFISDEPWGAKIVGAWTTSSSAPYVDIQGFEIDGNATNRIGLYFQSAHGSVTGCNVHNCHVGQVPDASGAAGIEAEGFSGQTDITIAGNWVHNCGSSASFDHGIYVIAPLSHVYNNRVDNITGFGIHCWHDDDQETIVNNTVFHCGGGLLFGGGDYYHGGPPGPHNMYIANNIFVGNTVCYNQSGDIGSGNVYTNNLDWLNGTLQTGTHGTLLNQIHADPRFLDYQADGSGDYHLSFDSPAVDAGTGTNAPTTDFDGHPRPSRFGFDLGAFEVTLGTIVLNVPDPYTTPWPRWAAELCLQDPRLPFPPSEQAWVRWAAELVNFSAFAVLNPPLPVYYSRWQDWAARLRESALAGG